MVWGLVSLPALTQGRVRNADPFQTGIETTVSCEQAESNGLLGPAATVIFRLHCSESRLEVSSSLGLTGFCVGGVRLNFFVCFVLGLDLFLGFLLLLLLLLLFVCFLKVCLLFHSLSDPHEQSSTEESAGPGSSGLAKPSCRLAGLAGRL